MAITNTPATIADTDQPAIWRRSAGIAPRLPDQPVAPRSRLSGIIPIAISLMAFLAILLWAVAGEVHP